MNNKKKSVQGNFHAEWTQYCERVFYPTHPARHYMGQGLLLSGHVKQSGSWLRTDSVASTSSPTSEFTSGAEIYRINKHSMSLNYMSSKEDLFKKLWTWWLCQYPILSLQKEGKCQCAKFIYAGLLLQISFHKLLQRFICLLELSRLRRGWTQPSHLLNFISVSSSHVFITLVSCQRWVGPSVLASLIVAYFCGKRFTQLFHLCSPRSKPSSYTHNFTALFIVYLCVRSHPRSNLIPGRAK